MNEHEQKQPAPEHEVDQLIADFGRDPDEETMQKIRDTLESQQDKRAAIEQALEIAEEQERSRELGQDRDRGMGR